MRILYVFLSLILFGLSSCTETIQGDKTPEPVEEISLSKNGKTATMPEIDEILTDAVAIYDQIFANPTSVIETELEWLEGQGEKGNDVNLRDFLVDHLNVSAGLIDGLSGYNKGQKDAIGDQAEKQDQTSGVLYGRYMNLDDDINNPWARKEPCAPECCGGFRPLRIITLMVACVVTVEIPIVNGIVCGRAVDEIIEFAEDGCLSEH